MPASTPIIIPEPSAIVPNAPLNCATPGAAPTSEATRLCALARTALSAERPLLRLGKSRFNAQESHLRRHRRFVRRDIRRTLGRRRLDQVQGAHLLGRRTDCRDFLQIGLDGLLVLDVDRLAGRDELVRLRHQLRFSTSQPFGGGLRACETVNELRGFELERERGDVGGHLACLLLLRPRHVCTHHGLGGVRLGRERRVVQLRQHAALPRGEAVLFRVAVHFTPRDGLRPVLAVLTPAMERVEVAEQVGVLARRLGDGELLTCVCPVGVLRPCFEVVPKGGAVRLALREREGGADMRD
jgi:hypothetical protein